MSPKQPSAPRHSRQSPKWLRITGWSLLGLLTVVVAALTALTFWLSPARLSDMVSRESSRWLRADVRVHNMRFTFWSTFPHLSVSADSVTVLSRTLDSLPSGILSQLPPDAASLASAASLHASIDVVSLARGRISLHDVSVDRLRLNLVAYNDSINNYNIVPDHAAMPEHVPYCTANLITITNPQPLTYFSAANDTRISCTLAGASLRRLSEPRSEYRLSVDGKADMTVARLHLLRSFPFKLSGKVRLGFDPLMVKVSDYEVSLADIKGSLSLSASLGGDTPGVSALSYSMSAFRPMLMLRYLDPAISRSLRDLSADIDVAVAARLTAPWQPSVQPLPSLEVNIDIPRGVAAYAFDSGLSCRIDHIDMHGRLVFDGQRPDSSYIIMPRLNAQADGLDVSLTARVTGLLGTPRVTGTLNASADMATVSRNAGLGWLGVSGLLRADTQFAFSLDTIGSDPLGTVRITGDIGIDRPSAKVPTAAGDMTIRGRKVSLSFESNSTLAGGTAADAVIVCDTVNVAWPGAWATVCQATVNASTDARSPLSELPLSLAGSMSGVRSHIDRDTLAMALRNACLTLDTRDVMRLARSLRATLRTDSVTVDRPGLHFGLADMAVNASNTATGDTAASFAVCYQPPLDAPSLAAIPHTPAWLVPALGGSLGSFVASNSYSCRVTASGGTLVTPAFPTANRLYDLDLTVTPDTVLVSSLALRAGDTGMRLRGLVAGLRPFMLAHTPQPLDVALDVTLDTVNINRLARIYEDGVRLTKGEAAAAPQPHTATVTPTDSTAVLIPRNIRADIRATAAETVYDELRLQNLATRLHIEGGVADIDTLHVASDFGAATMRLHYATDDIQAMGLRLEAALDSIDLVRFFGNFHALLLMMPQMRNLSGTVSAQASMSLGIFPDMYADVPSLAARVALQGRGLTVHQSPFIRHITRMMMIHTDRDLHIANMNVNATVHDDLLELDPFVFEFDSYRLRMEGLNNFEGRLYYHIGIEKWPLRIPFGINITGHYSHPELRFGGAVYKVDEGRKVTEVIETTKTFNIVKEAKYYIREFVRKAAEPEPGQ